MAIWALIGIAVLLGAVALVSAANVLADDHDQLRAMEAEEPGSDPFIKPYRRSQSARVFGQDRYKPPGRWEPLTDRIKVAGVYYRKDAASLWLSEVQRAEAGGRPYGITLVPDPKNPKDRHAIKVIGHVVGVGSWHIGFVPREVARDLSLGFARASVPFVGVLYSIYESDAQDIDVNFMVVADAERLAAHERELSPLTGQSTPPAQ